MKFFFLLFFLVACLGGEAKQGKITSKYCSGPESTIKVEDDFKGGTATTTIETPERCWINFANEDDYGSCEVTKAVWETINVNQKFSCQK